MPCRKPLLDALKRFAVEGLCLLILLLGFPAQALQAAPPHSPEPAQEPKPTDDPKALDTLQSMASQAVDSTRRSFDQPWMSALGLMLGLVAYTVPQGEGFEDSPPDEPASKGCSEATVKELDPATIAATLAQRNTLTAIPLLPGYNLISLPKAPTSSDPADVLAPIAGTFEVAHVFDGCAAEGAPWRCHGL